MGSPWETERLLVRSLQDSDLPDYHRLIYASAGSWEVRRSFWTLMMLASWEDNPYELAHWPKERQEAYLQECPAAAV